MNTLANAPGAQAASSFEKLPDDLQGKHNATFTVGKGLSEPVWTYDGFKECKTCMGAKTIGDEPCRACDGTGKKKYQEVFLTYELENGRTVREGMNYRLSAPFQMANGTSSSPTTLYVRFAEFSDLTDVDEIKQWAADNEGARVPLLIAIAPNRTKKYLKVTTVLKMGSLEGGQPQADEEEDTSDLFGGEDDEVL